ncbi:MAG: STAS domain-containing protein [Proteobacteria bacterium]|nr:STAS domain-containing protein [Pseudomonadota bacterium]MBU1582080.1 STAS domain-containing protein [Pseudomonadota bacterium]MBU2455017.1 STAS domain-containing protein [Pseudomonadota bacterium]MBU2629959.1 STAS domain-containing protein [Pseudomonadota bacterium]
MSFKIKSEQKENIGVIMVEGEVDMFTSPSLRDKLVPFFEKGVKGIIVDLSGVSFMDSSGIATLVEGLQWSKKNNKAFVLTGLGTNVLNALTLTKLDNVFTIKTNTDDAYKQLCAH